MQYVKLSQSFLFFLVTITMAIFGAEIQKGKTYSLSERAQQMPENLL